MNEMNFRAFCESSGDDSDELFRIGSESQPVGLVLKDEDDEQRLFEAAIGATEYES